MKTEITLVYQLQRQQKGTGWEDVAGSYPSPTVARDVVIGKQHEATATRSGAEFRIVEIRKRVVK